MSTVQAKENQLQGRWILRQGLVPRQTLTQMLHMLQAGAPGDLCSLLMDRGYINQDQALVARRAARHAITNSFDRNKISEISGHGESSELVRPAPVQHAISASEESHRAVALATQIDHSSAADDHSNLDHSLDHSREKLGKGDLFRDYEILDEVSRGAMGVIFRARHCISEELVALKFILQNHPDESEVERFRQEAETLVQLCHDHIIKISDFGDDKGRLFYAMELIEGRDLYSVVKQSVKLNDQVPPIDQSLDALKDVASALAYCHEHDVIHRDIKPQNILIEKSSLRAVLVDFGLRKKLESDSRGLTRTGEILGTPAFMSPEQFSPGGSYGDLGPATDVWAFGAVLFFALTGSSPFFRGTMVEIFQAITVEEAPHLKARNPDAPDWLSDLCADCLQKQAGDRPSIQEVLEILESNTYGVQESLNFKAAYKIIGVVALTLLVGIAALFTSVLFETEVIVFEELKSDLKVTNKDKVELRGRLSRGPATIIVNKKHKVQSKDGRFVLSVPLTKKNAANEFLVSAEIGDQKIPSQTITILHDKVPPDISLTLRKDKRYATAEDNLFRGTITGIHKEAEYLLNGQKFKLGKFNSFAQPLQDKRLPQTMVLTIVDKAGNTGSKSVDVYTSAAKPLLKYKDEHLNALKQFATSHSNDTAERDILLSLCDLELWARCPQDKQDAAIALIGKRLGDRFQFVETVLQQCEGLKFRLATFRHKKTGIKFQLIPGDLKTTVFWEEPLIEYTANYLKILGSKDSTPQTIATSLVVPPSTNYIKDFQEKHNIPQTGEPALHFQRARQISVEFTPERIPNYRRWVNARLAKLRDENKRKSLTEYIPPFLFSRFETSREQWAKISPPPRINLGLGMSTFLNNLLGPKFPVITGYAPCKTWLEEADPIFRLPSRQEWALAALGGSKSRFFWGDSLEDMPKYAVVYGYWLNSFPRQIDSHEDACNAFGLADLHGNVAEWVDPSWDSWQASWPEASARNELFVLGPENVKEWGLTCGGYSWVPAPLCQREMTYYQPNLQESAIFGQVTGLRVAASIP
jgi:hypothetical protein